MSDTKGFGQKRACRTLIIIVTHHCNEKRIAHAVAIRGYKTTQMNRNPTPSSIPLERSYKSLQYMKSIPCRSTSFMLSQSFRDGLKSVYRSKSGRWTIWGIGKSSRKNIYCTHLVPICSSRKGEYDGILVCTLIVNR